MRSIRKQRGFLLNPYRFAGSTQQGAFSADGAATVTAVGAASASSVLASDGASVLTVENGQASSAAVSMDGASVATLVGASVAATAASADAAGEGAFSPEATALTCDAADFDGTNDLLLFSGTPTGLVDSKLGTFSCWLRLDGGDSSGQLLIANNGKFRLLRTSANIFQFIGARSDGTTVLDLRTTGTYTAGASWLHILASWNMGVAGSSRLYISDVSDKNEVTFTDNEIDYATSLDWAVGALISSGSKLNGCLAEVYFAPGEYLDFSVESVRRRFITSGGKPANLGSTGSVPTGTAPIVYLHLDDSETANNLATNRGTGGNFTVIGSLDTASSSPSD